MSQVPLPIPGGFPSRATCPKCKQSRSTRTGKCMSCNIDLPLPPRILSFTAIRTTIVVGQTVEVSWELSETPISLEIDGDRIIPPQKTGRYRLKKPTITVGIVQITISVANRHGNNRRNLNVEVEDRISPASKTMPLVKQNQTIPTVELWVGCGKQKQTNVASCSCPCAKSRWVAVTNYSTEHAIHQTTYHPLPRPTSPPVIKMCVCCAKQRQGNVASCSCGCLKSYWVDVADYANEHKQHQSKYHQTATQARPQTAQTQQEWKCQKCGSLTPEKTDICQGCLFNRKIAESLQKKCPNCSRYTLVSTTKLPGAKCACGTPFTTGATPITVNDTPRVSLTLLTPTTITEGESIEIWVDYSNCERLFINGESQQMLMWQTNSGTFTYTTTAKINTQEYRVIGLKTGKKSAEDNIQLSVKAAPNIPTGPLPTTAQSPNLWAQANTQMQPTRLLMQQCPFCGTKLFDPARQKFCVHCSEPLT